MKKFKKLFFVILLFVVVCISAMGNVSVNAAKVVIKEEDNDLGVVLYSLNNNEYYIEINEVERCGYVYEEKNGNITLLGTCSITIIIENDLTIYEDLSVDSFGSIIIEISNSSCGEGYVLSVTGTLSEIFEENENINFIE